jgi:hypothetical protein
MVSLLTLEVGYAHALGKTIVFVDEVEGQRARYFDMVHSVASRIFPSLKDALNALQTSIKQCVSQRRISR